MGDLEVRMESSEGREQVRLSNFEMERISQEAKAHMERVGNDDLRKLRAWLLDVVQDELTAHLDLAKLVGTLVHDEVKRRESKRFKLWSDATLSYKSLALLATFPDLDPPAHLVKSPSGKLKKPKKSFPKQLGITLGWTALVFVILVVAYNLGLFGQ